jgi:hypothetical protein
MTILMQNIMNILLTKLNTGSRLGLKKSSSSFFFSCPVIKPRHSHPLIVINVISPGTHSLQYELDV